MGGDYIDMLTGHLRLQAHDRLGTPPVDAPDTRPSASVFDWFWIGPAA
jgi:hypothetical protein